MAWGFFGERVWRDVCTVVEQQAAEVNDCPLASDARLRACGFFVVIIFFFSSSRVLPCVLTLALPQKPRPKFVAANPRDKGVVWKFPFSRRWGCSKSTSPPDLLHSI